MLTVMALTPFPVPTHHVFSVSRSQAQSLTLNSRFCLATAHGLQVRSAFGCRVGFHSDHHSLLHPGQSAQMYCQPDFPISRPRTTVPTLAVIGVFR